MNQPALDRRLGTVGANPQCCFRTATHLVTHYHRYSRKRRRQAASSDIPQIKEAGCAHCCFFTPQPHRPKTRHQKWPSETESRNERDTRSAARQRPRPDAEIVGGGSFILHLPSHHSITSSARAISVRGISRPSARAVLR